jgi:hypothetical protein
MILSVAYPGIFVGLPQFHPEVLNTPNQSARFPMMNTNGRQQTLCAEAATLAIPSH